MSSPPLHARACALNDALLNHDSATEVVAEWRGVDTAQVVARRAPGPPLEAGAEARELLRVGSREPVRHRRVALSVAGVVLSEADNWYVPSRLTPAMNRLLDETEIPFGPVVRPIGFQRRTLDAVVMDEGATHILRHRALLVAPDGLPISLVSEAYARSLLTAGDD